jgi:EAL domain-containing protein (putative c-di-GMP-specific phosphodiesterase class I)
LYEAKKSGRNCVVSARNARAIYSIAAKLHEAVESGRLRAAYQPIMQLSTGKQVAEEALARMLDEQGQVVAAADFIETATEMQLTHLIDHEVISQTIRRCTSNLHGGSEPLTHFVNVSAGLLLHPDLTTALFAQAQEACGQCDTDSLASTKPLVLEINEKQVFGDIEAIKMKLLPFVGLGIRLAINGFGGGCSSFRYLADLPISFIKIDGELVRRVRDKRIHSIIKRICDISGDLDLVTIAQFVEDADTLDILRELGVDWGQGYLFGRPVLPGG